MKNSTSKKPVRVHLLNDESVLLVFDSKASVQQLFDQVCSHLSIKEGQFFGLSTIVESEKWFMDMKQKIAKYAPKDWGKEIRRRASDLNVASSSVLNVQFQVQFYVEHPKLISDKTSRHLYYLQMKKNMCRSRVLTQDEILFTLASLALQADIGDHDSSAQQKQYFKVEDYFPAWFIEKWGQEYLLSHLPTLHNEHRGMTSFESQAQYIQQASGIDDVPVHYYKLYKHKKESKASVLLGIFHQGIRIHYGNPDKSHLPWKLEFEFMWNKVGRLFFTGKRFEIYPEDLPASRRLTYYTGSHSRSKYLLHFLRETHSLYMSLSPYAQHMRRVDGRRMRRRYRESYISGKNLEMERNVDGESNETHSTDNEDEIHRKNQEKDKMFKSYYNSTTSHGSSHTSGIESDSKQRTEEEDEDDTFADDDDSEHQRQFVNITEDHLVGPAPKSLSVNNLTSPSAEEMKFTFSKEKIKEIVGSNKPSRDSTLKGEDFSIAAISAACDNNNLKKHSSLAEDSREGTLKNGVSLDVLVSAASMKLESESKEKDKKASSKTSPKRKGSKPDKVKTRERTRSDMATQTSTPPQIKKPNHDLKQPKAAHVEDKSNLYYDDFHTIPRKPRHSRSHTEEAKSSGAMLTVARKGSDVQDEHRGRKSRKPREKHEKNSRRSASAHPKSEVQADQKPQHEPKETSSKQSRKMYRTQSSDSHTHNQRKFIVNHETKALNRGKSVSSVPTDFIQQNPVLLPRHNSAFVAVTRPAAQHCDDYGRAYYTVARADSHDKHMYFRTKKGSSTENIVTVGSLPDGKRVRKHDVEKKPRHSNKTKRHGDMSDRERFSSYEDETFTQKMSEVCVRTISAQQRKLSDSRLNQRMDSGRSSLQTTDDSGCCQYPPLKEREVTNTIVMSSPQTPHSKHPPHYDLLRTPFIENYKEVIV